MIRAFAPMLAVLVASTSAAFSQSPEELRPDDASLDIQPF
jgi:hypothetical protein